jgi:pimeloyl-ACP methyl ester carboxylesterase
LGEKRGAVRGVEEVAGTRLKVIPDSNHFLPLEKGEEVARILIEFFD